MCNSQVLHETLRGPGDRTNNHSNEHHQLRVFELLGIIHFAALFYLCNSPTRENCSIPIVQMAKLSSREAKSLTQDDTAVSGIETWPADSLSHSLSPLLCCCHTWPLALTKTQLRMGSSPGCQARVLRSSPCVLTARKHSISVSGNSAQRPVPRLRRVVCFKVLGPTALGIASVTLSQVVFREGGEGGCPLA